MKQFTIFHGDVVNGATLNFGATVEACAGVFTKEAIDNLDVSESLCEVTMGGFATIVRIEDKRNKNKILS